MSNTPSVAAKPGPQHIIARINREVYDDFAKRLKGKLPMVPTDPIAAGFALGVEYVLTQLREGLVIGTDAA